MVIKRQCSFCAGEIEPGTGLMFVKRDGSVYHFCSGSCRKQQMILGRVGHRVRWTRAHTLKRQQASVARGPGRSPVGPAVPASTRPTNAEPEVPTVPTVPTGTPPAPVPAPGAPTAPKGGARATKPAAPAARARKDTKPSEGRPPPAA